MTGVWPLAVVLCAIGLVATVGIIVWYERRRQSRIDWLTPVSKGEAAALLGALTGFYGAILLLAVLPTKTDPRGGTTVQGPYGAFVFAWVIADFALIYWLAFRAARRPGAPSRRGRYARTQRAATEMFLPSRVADAG